MNSEFLDSQQYSLKGISRYESVWGEGFVSPGGATKAREFIAMLALSPGSRVLDVGCGLGGSAFLMAQEFDLIVDGIDLSQNMLAQAQQRCRAKGLEDRVHLSFGDCLELEAFEQYDAVISRDAFLHIHDKERLFRILHRCLKPRGQLLLTDYCCAAPPWSESFGQYVAQLNYCLHSLEEYVDLVEKAGFIQVQGRDLTDQFVLSLQDDLAKLGQLPDSETLRQGWQAKLQRAQAGEQRWGIITARKANSDSSP